MCHCVSLALKGVLVRLEVLILLNCSKYEVLFFLKVSSLSEATYVFVYKQFVTIRVKPKENKCRLNALLKENKGYNWPTVLTLVCSVG